MFGGVTSPLIQHQMISNCFHMKILPTIQKTCTSLLSIIPYVDHRPPAVGSITREPSLCSSTDGINRNQRDWICWDWTNNKLKMGPNLKLESFIAFYARHVKSNIYLRDPVYNRPNFRKEICEQSKLRFGGVGIFCVPFKYIASGESEGECPPNAKKSLSVCHYHNQPDDGCICIDDQYHKILPASTH